MLRIQVVKRCNEENKRTAVRKILKGWLFSKARPVLLGLVCMLFAYNSPALIPGATTNISAVWETVYGARGLDPGGDADGDGQSNLAEAIAGTNPFDSNSVFRVSASRIADPAVLVRWQSVAGIKYQIESVALLNAGQWAVQGPVVYGTGNKVLGVVPYSAGVHFFRVHVLCDNPAVEWSRPYLGEVDTDGDGVADLDEFAEGTDPFDPGSFLDPKEITLGRAMTLSWDSVAGKAYQIQSSATATGPWTNIGSAFQGIGEPMAAAVEVARGAAFFRVAVADVDTDGDGVTDWEEAISGIPGTDFGAVGHATNSTLHAEAIRAVLRATNVISVQAASAVADVTAGTSGGFLISRSRNINPLTVYYKLSGTAKQGTDFQAVTGTVYFAAGIKTVEVPIVPKPGIHPGLGKSVLLSLQQGSGFSLGTNASAEVRILEEIALSVKDFGANGNGETDDTAAVQAAINALETASNYNTLDFPAGTYVLATPTWIWDPDNTGWWELLHLGQSDLRGRDLILRGKTNSVLYSTVNTNRARILMVRASFRSLTCRGMHWQKNDTALLEMAPGYNPNGSEAVWVKNVDLRDVEHIEFAGCTFYNCLGAFAAYGLGYDLRNKLHYFRMHECQVLNPFGSNTTNAWLAWGGGVQVQMNGWIGTALYANNTFDGGSDVFDPVKNPGGIRLDGAAFGSPRNLIFTNNVVLRMGMEAVSQGNDNTIGYNTASFMFPPADGSTVQDVPVTPYPTTFVPGQILAINTDQTTTFTPAYAYLRVISYDAGSNILRVVNAGISTNGAGWLVPAYKDLLLQSDEPTWVQVSGNQFLNGDTSYTASTPFGNLGIMTIAKGVVANNFIGGYQYGIYIYPDTADLMFPACKGLVMRSNIVKLRNWGSGIFANGPSETISHNLVVAPTPDRVLGVLVAGTNSWIEANTVINMQAANHGYASAGRAVGIALANGSSQNTAVANRTRGMDVGVGPADAYQLWSHRVISHFSTNDVLPIDPRGLQ
jgi:Pectate lyase superfamily protein/Bacterial TSP3 repeat